MVICNWNSSLSSSSLRKCAEEGKENIRRWQVYFDVTKFICKEHTDRYLELLETNGWEYAWLKPEHVCGLILCKKCMRRVRELLSY